MSTKYAHHAVKSCENSSSIKLGAAPASVPFHLVSARITIKIERLIYAMARLVLLLFVVASLFFISEAGSFEKV